MRRRLYRNGLGRVEQRTINEFSLTHVLNPRDIPTLFGAPNFLWKDGDKAVPTIGPVLAENGTPAEGQPTCHDLAGGEGLTQTDFGGSSSYTLASGAPLDPAGKDLVAIIRGRIGTAIPTTDYLFCNTGGGAEWWRFKYRTANTQMQWEVGGTAATASCVSGTDTLLMGSEFIAVGILDADGNCHLLMNELAAVTEATPAGTWGANEGIGLGAASDNSNRFKGGLSWAVCWHGENEADRWTADSYALARRLIRHALGLGSSQSDKQVTLDRESHAAWVDAGGTWRIASNGFPRAGDANGLRYENEGVNKAYANINNQSTAGWSVTGGGFSAIDDAAELLANNAQAWGPGVIRVNNSTGVDQYLYGGALVGNTNPHAIQIMGSYASGSGAELGLRDVSTGTFVKAVDIPGNYQRVGAIITPADTDCQFAVKIPHNCDFRAVASTLCEGSVVGFPIPNWQTAATATCFEEVPDTQVVLNDDQGSITGEIAPLGWSGDPPEIQRVFSLSTDLFCWVSTISQLRLRDGTNTVNSPVLALVDGQFVRFRLSWKYGEQYVSCEGESTEGDYDGDYSDNTLRIGRTTSFFSFMLRNLRIHRRYQRGDR